MPKRWKAMPHQDRVIPKMIRSNFMLVWDPGAGKTLPVLVAAFNLLPAQTLCIVPAHLRDQWAEQAGVYTPLMRVVILDETKKKIPDSVFRDADMVICSYEYASTLARWKQLRRHRWGAIAIDEAHYLMYEDAKRVRAILGQRGDTNGLVFAADVVWPLTGTPFTFPNQIYPILSRLFPEAIERDRDEGDGLMTPREWENKFCVVEQTSFGAKIVNAKNIPELRRRLAPVLDKAKLRDITPDLPPLTVDTIPIRGSLKGLTAGLDADLLDQYEMLVEILGDDRISDQDKLTELNESGLVMAQLRHTIATVKVKSTVELIRAELANGVDKLLVFGFHREPLKALARELDAPLIFGGITDRKKANAKDDFIYDRGCRVLAGQISAIGTGTDGLQHVAHRSIFMEASWRYLENKQCIHRLFRKGQKLPCYTSFLSLLNSVDEYVGRVLAKNAEIISKALD